MSTIRPTTPSERWLKQGEMLSRLKHARQASAPGTWMTYYRSTLQSEYGFSERSEQLCRQSWDLWCFAIDHGYRSVAEELLSDFPHVNDFVAALRRLRLIIHRHLTSTP